MRWVICLIFLFAGSSWAVNKVVIQRAKVKISADVRINALEFEVKGSSTTGQCMGILCGVTYPN